MPISPELIPDLLDLQVPRDISISPDGQSVIYTSTLAYGLRKAEHSLSTLTSGLFNDHSPKWSPDGKSIAFLSDRSSASKSVAIYALPLDGGEAYPVSPTECEKPIAKFEFSPCGKFIAYLSADEKSAERKKKDEENDDAQVWGEDWGFNRLSVVHVGTTKVDVLLNNVVHITDFTWNAECTKLAVVTGRTSDIESPLLDDGNKISIVDFLSKKEETICSFPHEVKNLNWAGQSLYSLGHAVPNVPLSSSVAYAVDLEKLAFEKHAHGDTDCAVRLSKAGEKLIVRVQHGMEDHVKVLNGRILLAKTLELRYWHVALTDEGNKFIIATFLGDTNHPTEVFTTTGSGDALTQLSNHGATFKDRPFGSVTYLNTPTLDTQEHIEGLFITPTAHAKADRSPTHSLATVVIVHGGPYRRNVDRFDASFYYWTNALLAAGYAVMHPNYRGSSGRGDKFQRYACGGMGICDEPDIVALTQHCIEKGFADKEKLIIGGYSQGGFLSYLFAVRNGMHGFGWKFKCAIAGAGIVDWGSLALSSDTGIEQTALGNGAPWNMHPDEISNRRGCAIYEMRKAAETGDVIPPVLILHDEKDLRVPMEQPRGFKRGLDFWKLPCTFVVYPREGHMFKEWRHVRDVVERVVVFADLCLG